MQFPRVTTKDVIAISVVFATLIFNGISLSTGRPLDPTTVGFTGIIIGHYFKGTAEPAPAPEPDLPAPSIGSDAA